MESYITEYMDLPKRICLPRETEINPELIKALIKEHEKNIGRYKTLQGYYEGKAKILERTKAEKKANNKIVLDYPSYIVDILLGMFVGKPISYTVEDENKEKFQEIQDVLDLNEEQDENTEVAKMAGIKGRAYEILYVNEESNILFNEVQPEDIILVYTDDIKPVPWLGLYLTDLVNVENLGKDKKDKQVTIYTADYIQEYFSQGGEYKLVDEYINPFREVPIIEYLNNNEGIGDFERVLSLIDAMNLSESDTTNDFEEFTDAFLILYGMLDTDNEDIKQLIEDKILLLDEAGQKAEWLIKEINDAALENHKTRFDTNIHKFAKVPNMSDEHFAGNVSGESMKYKLFATDQVISQKQRKFKSGLQRRFKLILNALSIVTGNNFDYRDITITFNDNKPYNELDNINTVKAALDAGLSKQYALGKLRDVDDVQEEIKRQEDEAVAYGEAFREMLNEEEEDESRTSLPSTTD